MKRYDFIIIGAGASGLSLACHLAASPLRDRSILLVEQSLHAYPNRTWAFWERAESPLGALVPLGEVAFHTWRRLLVATPGRTLTLRTHPYRYRAIRSANFHRAVCERLSTFPNIAFLEGGVQAVVDGQDAASISVGGEEYQGQWVFDSRFDPAGFHPGRRYHYLSMQIRGWHIETQRAAFDPQVATFLDFRTPQRRQARFLYVLPSDSHHALVEHVACIPATAKLMHQHEEEQVLKHYIARSLGVAGYEVVDQEDGVNPLTDGPFPRRQGPSSHVMSIGIAGGMLKPSTGFAFARIQRDSAAIMRSLLEHAHPFAVPRAGWPYRMFDPLALWAMAGQGERVGPLLSALFRIGRTPRILSFLDETGMPL